MLHKKKWIFQRLLSLVYGNVCVYGLCVCVHAKSFEHQITFFQMPGVWLFSGLWKVFSQSQWPFWVQYRRAGEPREGGPSVHTTKPGSVLWFPDGFDQCKLLIERSACVFQQKWFSPWLNYWDNCFQSQCSFYWADSVWASESFILRFSVVTGNKPFVDPCVSVLQDWHAPSSLSLCVRWGQVWFGKLRFLSDLQLF